MAIGNGDARRFGGSKEAAVDEAVSLLCLLLRAADATVIDACTDHGLCAHQTRRLAHIIIAVAHRSLPWPAKKALKSGQNHADWRRPCGTNHVDFSFLLLGAQPPWPLF